LIALDANILVHAHRDVSPWHAAAYATLSLAVEGTPPWAIPWPCVHEFYSVVTNPRIYSPPSTVDEAISQIEAWRESPSLVLLSENDAYWPHLHSLLTSSQVVGPRIHDARIAALCLAHGVRELLTADRDFTRFPTLRTRNPLIPR
jgi:uncharacterized protein